MPEFILPLGGLGSAKSFAQLDSFTRGYIEAMFFTSSGDTDDPIADETFSDIAPEALASIVADCAAFQQEHARLLDQAYEQGGDDGAYDGMMAGRDFWYTRNGHGVGFWDRGLGDIGELLSNISRHREISPYVGDDGLIYLT